MLLDIYNRFKELQELKGSKLKAQWVKDNITEDNKMLELILVLQFDPRITTNLAKKSINKNVKVNADVEIKTIQDCLAYLLNRCTGKDIDISNIRYYIEYVRNLHGDDVALFVENICIQNLKIGIKEDAINKAVGREVVYSWNVQGGKPQDNLTLKDDEVFALQLKLNGIRASYYKGELKARSGINHVGFNTIINEIKSIFGDNYFIDGELIRNNHDNISDNENFRKTLSIVNSKEYTQEKEDILFRIYDIIPINEYDNDDFKMKYISERMNFIQSFKDKTSNHLQILEVDYVGSDKTMIDKLLEKYDNLGLEGLMLYKDVTYKKSKHNGLIKIKSFKFSDLEILDWYEGEETGKWKGKFGGFTVNYKGNTVDIGGGYTDEQREYFTLNADNYIGRIAEIKYKEESMDSKTGLYSIQFPVFQRIREIGKDVSYE